MDVIAAIHGRRSVRSYDPRPVERELIERVIEDAAQAPPPFRGQVPWAFNVLQGVERIAAYGARAMEYARERRRDEPGGGWLDRPGFKIFWDAPVVIIISGPDGDCCRAGQNLMLAAHAKGLGSCWLGAPMPWLHSAGVAEELGLPRGIEPVVAVVLGHPADSPAGNPRPRPQIVWSAP